MKYKVAVDNIVVPVIHDDGEVIAEANKRLNDVGLGDSVSHLHIRKKSIDARKRDKIVMVCSAVGSAELTSKPPALPRGIKLIPEEMDEITIGSEPMRGRPVIAGFGPAGMFCALELAMHGYAPIVFERGGNIDERVRIAGEFMNGGDFSPVTNIQFGAGGAGTFSDGKLTTRIGDPLCSLVLERLCRMGAPENILWMAKPHIGTDVLRDIVRGAEAEIRRLGGEVFYGLKVTDIKPGGIKAGGEAVGYGALVLAIGHSARDTYYELMKSGFEITPKPFSAGIRIEHLKKDIDQAMYGEYADILPPAEYALSYREKSRGVYTFCMCPGGVVVPAASEEGGVVTNGMSYSSRNGKNSNSAVVVSVLPEDFGGSAAGAIEYQRALESAAYKLGGGKFFAPVQTLGNFLDGKSNSQGRIAPTYMNGNVRYCNIGEILPGYISGMLRTGLRRFGKSIRGFDCPDAILTGVETRTSAPVRIMRGDDRTASFCSNIYPCGEGAGYAGGIMSAAVDGIRTARAIISRFAQPKI